MIRKNVRGVDVVRKNLRESHQNYGVLFQRGLKKATKFLFDRTQEVVPVDNGDLKASGVWVVEGDGFEAVGSISYLIFYAVYVHENLENFHPNGQAKYIEGPVREYRFVTVKIILDEMKKSRDAKGRFKKVPKR